MGLRDGGVALVELPVDVSHHIFGIGIQPAGGAGIEKMVWQMVFTVGL